MLRDEERPAVVLAQWRQQGEEPHFNLRLRSSAIVRVHHSLGAGLQTFQSLIVTPTMTTQDVLQIAVAKLHPHDNPLDFELLEQTPHGGEVVHFGGDQETVVYYTSVLSPFIERVLGATEQLLTLTAGSTGSQIELRPKREPVRLSNTYSIACTLPHIHFLLLFCS